MSGIPPHHHSLPEGVQPQLQALAALLRRSLPESLLGLILHGSAATSGFEPGRSDLDVLAIVESPLTAAQRRAVGEGVLSLSKRPHPLEFSLIVKRSLTEWSHPCAHELHFGEEHRDAFARGELTPTVPEDPDLAMHLTLARSRGIDLLGTYPVQALPDIPPRDFLAALLDDFAWAAHQDDLADYRFANACRTLAYLREGLVLSKSEGTAWCRNNEVDTRRIVADVVNLLHLELDRIRG